jgi:hypothetical protein
MPEIKLGESQDAYVSRCIAYCIKNEGLTKEKAAGKCYGMYRNKKQGDSIAKHLGK